MTGFVYRWTNIINGKWYIGSHKGTIDDKYRHSSKIVKVAEKKYGLENFTREILFEGDYEKDQIRSVKEAEYLRKENAANNPMSYNLTNITGPDCFDKTVLEKIRKTSTGRKHTEKAKRKMSKAKRGKLHSEEQKRINAKSHIGQIPWNKGKKGCYSDETKHKMSESHKYLIPWNKGITEAKVSCPHCHKEGGKSIMKRWHFNNCKSSTEFA